VPMEEKIVVLLAIGRLYLSGIMEEVRKCSVLEFIDNVEVLVFEEVDQKFGKFLHLRVKIKDGYSSSLSE
jgi:hypothetical protein